MRIYRMNKQVCYFFPKEEIDSENNATVVVVDEDVRPVDDGDAKRHLGESINVTNSWHAA